MTELVCLEMEVRNLFLSQCSIITNMRLHYPLWENFIHQFEKNLIDWAFFLIDCPTVLEKQSYPVVYACV